MATNSHYLALDHTSSQCVYIDDVDQSGLDLAGDFTISFWAYFPSGQSSGSPVIINKDVDEAGERGYVLFYNLDTTPDRLTINLHEDDSTSAAIYWEFGRSAAWYHFLITCDISNGLSTKCELFINGISQGNGTTSGSNVTSINTNSQPFIVGASTSDGTTDPNTMYIDNLKIYNEVVDGDDGLQYSTSGAVESGHVAFWPFDNNLFDATGDNNALTGVNSPTFGTDVVFTTYGLLNKYNSGMDGYVLRGQEVANRSTTWTNVHGGTAGDSIVADNNTGNDARASIERGQAGANTWIVYRFFVGFDTSALTGDDTVLGGFLWLNRTNVDFDVAGDLALVNPTPASDTVLVAEDFDQCGDINSPDEGASRFDTDDIATGTWFPLNSTGLGWVNISGYTQLGVRIADDLSDSTPSHTGSQRTMIEFATKEHSTETRRPWLGLVLTDAEPSGGGGAGDPIDGGTGNDNAPAPTGPPDGQGGSGPAGASDEGTAALAFGMILDD